MKSGRTSKFGAELTKVSASRLSGSSCQTKRDGTRMARGIGSQPCIAEWSLKRGGCPALQDADANSLVPRSLSAPPRLCVESFSEKVQNLNPVLPQDVGIKISSLSHPASNDGARLSRAAATCDEWQGPADTSAFPGQHRSFTISRSFVNFSNRLCARVSDKQVRDLTAPARLDIEGCCGSGEPRSVAKGKWLGQRLKHSLGTIEWSPKRGGGPALQDADANSLVPRPLNANSASTHFPSFSPFASSRLRVRF